MLCLTGVSAWADTLRVATYNTELSRKGPGLLLRDLRRGEDGQIDAVIAGIVAADADIITLQGIDYDIENAALIALRDRLAEAGVPYDHVFAARPNAGLRTDLDLDGDGKSGGPGDAQGYGRFFGQASMAVMSKHPIRTEAVKDFSSFLWRDHPAAIPPMVDGQPFPIEQAQARQRLFSHGGWVVPIDHPGFGVVTVMTFHATPPVFDGPEDRNGRRNHDEVTFWRYLMDGAFGDPPAGQFFLAGDANLDPSKGDGRSGAIRSVLDDPRLQDPLPDQATVNWSQTGPMRVDYVLPSADWTVLDAGVAAENETASRHRLVWVEVNR